MTDSTTTPALDLDRAASTFNSFAPREEIKEAGYALVAEIRSLRNEVAKLKAAPLAPAPQLSENPGQLAQAPTETGFSVVMRDESFRQAKETAGHITRMTQDTNLLMLANKIFRICADALGDHSESGSQSQPIEKLEQLAQADDGKPIANPCPWCSAGCDWEVEGGAAEDDGYESITISADHFKGCPLAESYETGATNGLSFDLKSPGDVEKFLAAWNRRAPPPESNRGGDAREDAQKAATYSVSLIAAYLRQYSAFDADLMEKNWNAMATYIKASEALPPNPLTKDESYALQMHGGDAVPRSPESPTPCPACKDAAEGSGASLCDLHYAELCQDTSFFKRKPGAGDTAAQPGIPPREASKILESVLCAYPGKLSKVLRNSIIDKFVFRMTDHFQATPGSTEVWE